MAGRISSAHAEDFEVAESDPGAERAATFADTVFPSDGDGTGDASARHSQSDDPLPAVEADEQGPASTDGYEPAPDPWVGKLLCDRYRVEALLGAGGMGAVYRAVHVHMRKNVALKVLHRQMTYVPEAVARFEREAVAAARITHPNVAAATDFGRLPDGSFYLALEFVEGSSLRRLIHEQGALPTVRAVNIVRQIAEALEAAHAQGVVHRDLKPENVMLLDRGHQRDFVKVLDFGIAKVSSEGDGEKLTQMGSVFGTPDYMSPEQAAGQPVDHRSDLYALGVVFYELLTGDTPFGGDSIAVVLAGHMHQPPPPLPAAVDWRLADIISRLLAKDPADRHQSARQLINELLALRLSVIPDRPQTQFSELLRRRLGPAAGWVWTRASQLAGTVVRTSAGIVGPIVDRAERALVARFPRFSPLTKRIRLGSAHVSYLSIGMLALMIGGVLGALLLVAPSPPIEANSGGATQLEPDDDVELADVDDPAEPEQKPTLTAKQRTRLTDLQAIAVYKRKKKDWIELGQLLAAAGEWSESTSAYRNAIQLDKDTASNPAVIQAIRTSAEHRDSYESAINVAVNLLGEPGLDLVYDLWMTTKDNRKQRLIAELAYKKLEILRVRRASKALRVRLDLEFSRALECEDVQKIVESATRNADQRSVKSLEALKRRDGCGSDKSSDCYPCLRENDDLGLALQTAEEHAGPRFDGERYVPAP